MPSSPGCDSTNAIPTKPRSGLASPPTVTPMAVAVDLVVLTIRHRRLCALLVRRGIEPYAGRWALPGGFVLEAEDLIDAAYRELFEETGIGGTVHLEQLRTYGEPDRDPRGRTIAVAYLALAASVGEPVAGSDALSAAWVDVSTTMMGAPGGPGPGVGVGVGVADGLDTGTEGQPLAFDHPQILCDGIERARAKLEYTALGAAFCPPEFTVAQLRAVYEAVWGRDLDPRNFHRKVTGTPGFVEPTGHTTSIDGGRPAKLYRRGPQSSLNPPLTRPTV